MDTPSLSAHPGHGESRMGGQWDLLSDVRVLRPTLSPQPPPVCLVVPGQLVNNFTRDLASLFLSWKPPPPPSFFFFLDLFIYFLAVVGLCCHMQAFSSWDERGLLSSCGAWVSYCGGFSCCRAWALDVGSEVVAHRLSCSAAHAIFPHQGPNCVLCIARQIFNHWTTRETPQTSFLTTYLPSYLV